MQFTVTDDVVTLSLADLVEMLQARTDVTFHRQKSDEWYTKFCDMREKRDEAQEQRDAMSDCVSDSHKREDRLQSQITDQLITIARLENKLEHAQNVRDTDDRIIRERDATLIEMGKLIPTLIDMSHTTVLSSADIQALAFIKLGLYIQAIKYYRETMSVGLEVAKERIDWLREHHSL